MVDTINKTRLQPPPPANVGKVVQVEPKLPVPRAGGPLLPKVNAQFEPNEAFADFDNTMAGAIAVLKAVIAAPPFNGSIQDEQLAQLVSGKLNGKPLPLSMESLQNVAKLLTTPEGKIYKQTTLGNPINAAVLDATLRVGFSKAHEELLKVRLNTYAAALAGPLKPYVDVKTKTIKLDQLHGLLEPGVLASKVSDKDTRNAILDAIGMLTDNRRLYEVVGTMSADELKQLATVKDAQVAVKNGTYNWTVRMADVVSATNPAKCGLEPQVDVNDDRWLKDPKYGNKLSLLASEYDAFIANRKMVAMHEVWHGDPNNGSGGVTGAGSGERFLQFHANMGGDFVEFLKMRGKSEAALVDGRLPAWNDMTADLPKVFWEKGKKNIGWKLPSFLQTKVQQAATPGLASQALSLNGRKITNLDDCKTIDEVGRVWGESGAHAVAHVQLGSAMAGFKSVAERAFMPWHYGTLEKVRMQWLTQTENGKNWALSHPDGWSQPFIDVHDQVMHDVVDRVLRAESTFETQASTATRGGPVGSARGVTSETPAEARRTRAQDARRAKQEAERICTARLNKISDDAPFFTKDLIREAGAGLVDETEKKEAASRSSLKRSFGSANLAATSKPWR